jgi:hypothetical protein
VVDSDGWRSVSDGWRSVSDGWSGVSYLGVVASDGWSDVSYLGVVEVGVDFIYYSPIYVIHLLRPPIRVIGEPI